MRVRVLGQLEVTDGGVTVGAGDLPRRARQVLAVLAARYDRIQSKDALADAVWGTELPGNHVAALEHYVSVVRRRLQPQGSAATWFIVTRSGGYLFDTGRAELDLAELRQRVRSLDQLPPDGPERLERYEEILDLARELPFPEDPYADWAEAVRGEVQVAAVTALLKLADAALPRDPARAMRLAQQAIELDPFLEPAYRAAMTAAVSLGRPDEALRLFEKCRRALDGELGVPPSAELVRLQRAVLASRQGGPAAGRPGGPVPAAGRLSVPAPAAGRSGGPVAARPGGPVPGRFGGPVAGGPGGPVAAGSGGSVAGGPGGSVAGGPGGSVAGRPGGPAVASASWPGGPPPGPAFEPAPNRPERFVGRVTQLRMLIEPDPPPVTHVVGPHGAGKSAFLTELAQHAPGRVGIGRGASSVGALRLSWLRTALVELGAEPDVVAVVDAADPERPLGRDQLAIIGSAFDSAEPVFLCVDDAGDLDAAGVAELAWLSHHCPALRIVLTYTYPSQITGKPVSGLGTPVVLRLYPLTADELRPIGDDALEETGGIPALVAVLRRPREIALAVAMQVARLRTRWMPEESWEVLRLCAALGPLSAGDIVRLTDRSTADVLICIDRLAHANLLREDPDGRVQHSSALIREAVAEQVSSASSRHLKEQLAAALS